MEKIMAVENQQNELVKAPLMFIVPACGFVVAARTREFQRRQSTSEQVSCAGAGRPAASFRREIHPEQSLRELRRKTAFLNSDGVELLVFLFFGLVAIVAMMGCISELFHLLDNAVLEQTLRALLTK
jgi:hypothetical protein